MYVGSAVVGIAALIASGVWLSRQSVESVLGSTRRSSDSTWSAPRPLPMSANPAPTPQSAWKVWLKEPLHKSSYNVDSDTGSAFVVSGPGTRFYIWATEGQDLEDGFAYLPAEGYSLLGKVDETEVWSNGVRITWFSGAYRVWIAGGPTDGEDALPSIELIRPLIRSTNRHG